MIAAVIPTAIVGAVLAGIAGRYYASRNAGIQPDGIGFLVPGLALGVLFTGLIMLVVCVVTSRRNPPAVRVIDARIHLGLATLLWSPLLLLLATVLLRSNTTPFPLGLLWVLVPPVVALCGVFGPRVMTTAAAFALLACGPVWTLSTLTGLDSGGGIVGVPFAWATTLLATCAVVLLTSARLPRFRPRRIRDEPPVV